MKRRIPTLNEFIDEMVDLKPAKKWIDFDLQGLDQETMKYIWDMYLDTYGHEGLDLSATDMKDLQQKYDAIFLVDIDKNERPDAFIFYRKTPFGYKIALGGANKKKEAKHAFVKKTLELVSKKNSGWYAEGSMKMDAILKSNNVHFIDDEQQVKTILNKPIEWVGDGYYMRKLSRANKKITKRLYGYPKI